MSQPQLRDAKDAWLEKFEGASITKVTPSGSPTMRHLHKRSFGHVGRNCHFISVFGRILLGEDQISEAEDAVSKRLIEVTTAIERKISAMKAMVADRGLSDSLAQFNASTEVTSKIVVPTQNRFLTVITLGDQFLVLVNTLWLHGELLDREKARAELELKQLLRAIPATTRKMRIYLQAKLNDTAKKEDAPAAAAAKKALLDAEAAGATPASDKEEEIAELEIAPIAVAA